MQKEAGWKGNCQKRVSGVHGSERAQRCLDTQEKASVSQRNSKMTTGEEINGETSTGFLSSVLSCCLGVGMGSIQTQDIKSYPYISEVRTGLDNHALTCPSCISHMTHVTNLIHALFQILPPKDVIRVIVCKFFQAFH